MSERMEQEPGGDAGAVRVGGIDYLNALPLTRYLSSDGGPRLEVTNHVPSDLADMLRADRLDVALVPVVEYLASESYRVVPEVCISSYGTVQSIRLYHRRPLGQARVVGLDARSRTSALLTRLLFRELWGASPAFLDLRWDGQETEQGTLAEASRQDAPEGRRYDAVLLIGDAALSLPGAPGWEVLDLGAEWTRWTGLPFVYAFWVWRGGPCPPGLVASFIRAKERGLARIDEIVATAGGGRGGLDEAARRNYLNRVIQYDFGPAQVEGCLEFYARLERVGLIARAPRLLAYL